MGHLVCRPMLQSSRTFTLSRYKSFGAIRKTDVIPAFNDLAVEDVSTHKLHNSCNKSFLDINYWASYEKTLIGNTIFTSNSTLVGNITSLVEKIGNEHQKHDIYSLLMRFQDTLDVTKHNIPNTSIHHVVNTIPH